MIPYLNLDKMHEMVKTEIYTTIQTVVDNNWYIMGVYTRVTLVIPLEEKADEYDG